MGEQGFLFADGGPDEAAEAFVAGGVVYKVVQVAFVPAVFDGDDTEVRVVGGDVVEGVFPVVRGVLGVAGEADDVEAHAVGEEVVDPFVDEGVVAAEGMVEHDLDVRVDFLGGADAGFQDAFMDCIVFPEKQVVEPR